MNFRPFALIAQAQGALKRGMSIDKMRAIQKCLTHGREFRRIEIVNRLLPERVHLGSNVQRQRQLSSQADDLMEFLHFLAPCLGIGNVPIAVGDEVQGDHAFANEKLQ